MGNSYIGNMSQGDKFFEHYGITITSQGTNGMPSDLFVGISKDAFAHSTGMATGKSPLSTAAEDISKGAIDTIGSYLKKWTKFDFGSMATEVADIQTMGSTAKTYTTGNGGDTLSVKFVFIPGFLGNGSFKEAEKKLAMMTLPKKPSGPTLQTPYVSYYYGQLDKAKFMGDYFSESFIHVSIGNFFSSGGYYCTSANRTYSYEVDKYGKPIYMDIELTLEKWRGQFAEEIPKMFK